MVLPKNKIKTEENIRSAYTKMLSVIINGLLD